MKQLKLIHDTDLVVTIKSNTWIYSGRNEYYFRQLHRIISGEHKFVNDINYDL